MLMDKKRIALFVKLFGNMICYPDQNFFMSTLNGRYPVYIPCSLPVQAAAGIIAAR
jgi:hypothetical protein